MRWPFATKLDTDLRICRDPVTGKTTLRLVGPICFPGSDLPIVSITTTLDVWLDENGIKRLYEQLKHFASQNWRLRDCQTSSGVVLGVHQRVRTRRTANRKLTFRPPTKLTRMCYQESECMSGKLTKVSLSVRRLWDRSLARKETNPCRRELKSPPS